MGDAVALADLLGGDFGLAESHKLYATLAQVLPLKEKLFDHLRDQWRDLFGAQYEGLLYDLTSSYFETDMPADPADPRRHEVILTRHTQPEKELQVLLEQLKLTLPAQPPPKIIVAPPAL